MKKNGRSDETITTAILRLKRLARLTCIDEPEKVKEAIALAPWQNNTKNCTAQIYTGYAKYIGKPWTQPHYTEQNGLPFIPTEQELDALISASKHQRTATRLQILKETACRIGETETLKWADIDLERRVIQIRAEKGSNSRIVPISPKLADMLNKLPRKAETVFTVRKHGFRETFRVLRNQTADKLANPRLRAIHLHTFRHWKATTEYHATKDIVHVKTLLGHKSIETTMIYINLENAIFANADERYYCKIAKTPDEAAALIELGFEKQDEFPDGTRLYRKRK